MQSRAEESRTSACSDWYGAVGVNSGRRSGGGGGGCGKGTDKTLKLTRLSGECVALTVSANWGWLLLGQVLLLSCQGQMQLKGDASGRKWGRERARSC